LRRRRRGHPTVISVVSEVTGSPTYASEKIVTSLTAVTGSGGDLPPAPVAEIITPCVFAGADMSAFPGIVRTHQRMGRRNRWRCCQAARPDRPPKMIARLTVSRRHEILARRRSQDFRETFNTPDERLISWLPRLKSKKLSHDVLSIRPASVTIDFKMHTRKYLNVELDPAVTLQDFNDRPDLWRLCQQNPNKALSPNDVVEFRAAEWTAFARVNSIDAGAVHL